MKLCFYSFSCKTLTCIGCGNIYVLTGTEWGRHVSSFGKNKFLKKIEGDGGFQYYTHEPSGGLNPHERLVVMILPEEDWPKKGDRLFIDVNESECNCGVDSNGNIVLGRGPKLGPGITNLGQYYILLDGGHRLPVLRLQYVIPSFWLLSYMYIGM